MIVSLFCWGSIWEHWFDFDFLICVVFGLFVLRDVVVCGEGLCRSVGAWIRGWGM